MIKIEHPAITRTLRTGYPEKVVDQPECEGTDYFGDEILTGDDVVVDGEETILQNNLEEYLSDVYGMKFLTIK
ncbi:YqaI family protein [Mesobacillus sp. S13]|uniref:YqaI family protein n=1 Tax=Mesobacillus sp. S13 TaxID=2880221 RepID=UPI00299E576B|nr:hypothetical protein [Mesobacillus sp. S13]